MEVIQKRALLVQYFFLWVLSTNAQTTVNPKGLRVGDKMPDVSLKEAGDVIYNKTGAAQFSDLKGKLIILDFWDVGCASCIAGFPYMQSLQKQFKDSIQIILVNPAQKQSEINERFKNKNIKVDPFPYDLPQIVNAKLLGNLFPHSYSGHQVWIDGNGTICLRGHPMNTHAQKIREVLAGKKITYVKEEKGRDGLEEQTPLLASIYNRGPEFLPLIQSAIYPYDNDGFGACGTIGKNLKDIGNNLIRNTYINVSLLSLFNNATLEDYYYGGWENEIKSSSGDIPFLNKFILEVKDTLRYTSDFLTHERDIDWVKSQFSYEQIIPDNLGAARSRQYMLDDLNRYFGNLYGTKVQIEKRNQACYLLVRTDSFKPGKIKSQALGTGINRFNKNGKKMIGWQSVKLSSLLQSYADILFRTKMLPFLDETNFKEPADIYLPDPETLNTIEELKIALKPYGLDIVVAERQLSFVVVKDSLQ